MSLTNHIIGKNVLDNLTLSMYKDSRIIYREYIQNSADAIDDAVSLGIVSEKDAAIVINLDTNKRIITIEDNATGISKDKAVALLCNIADSEKDQEIKKGFRGIGRLGGLAYCKTLIFETSYKGEDVKTIITWNAQLLQQILNDNSNHEEAQQVLNKIVTVKYEPIEKGTHYFKVILEDINKSNSELLNKNEIIEYLEQVAPVEYKRSKFILQDKILEKVKEKGYRLDTYNIYFENQKLSKAYQCTLKNLNNEKYDEIVDLEFNEFYNSKNELLAWSWIGISTFDGRIPIKTNLQHNIRLKKHNIQIGDANTLNFLHKEPLGNQYFIGEVQAVHKELRPNGRRDYFIENEMLKEFENKLREYFMYIYSYYRIASETRSTSNTQNKYIEKKEEIAQQTQKGFISNKSKEKEYKELEVRREKALKAQKNLEKIQNKASQDPTLHKIVQLVQKTNVKKVTIPEQVKEPSKVKKYRTDNLTKLNRNERKLVGEIYEIINTVLDPDTANNLINKIEENYK